MHVAAARCVAELLGLSGSVEFLLGQPEDVLPQLLGSHGRNAVEVLILRGGSEEAYLSQLKHVEELGLFTFGCILADHMLRYGSPRFLQEMLTRRRLELVEVVDSQGLDWMALSVAPSAAAALPAPPWPPGLAALTARVRRAWRGSPAAELEQRIVRCAREMGLSPTRRFRTETASVRPLPSQVCPTSSLRLPVEAEPEPAPHGRSPRVAQEYLRSLDFKRWLTELDPSGGCLEHLPQALQRYDTVEQLQEAWEDNEKCFEALGLTCPARQRLKQRWVQVHSNLPPASATGALPPSAAAVQEDTVIDLKHLSFSDWLASVDVSLDLQQYLPCIQESYDTVSQIVATYTVENGSHEKTLDPQLFEDFAVDVAAHRAAFRSWFVRFCGVKCDGWEDPSTPHFGEEGEVPGAPKHEVHEVQAELPSVPETTEGTTAEDADAPKNDEPGASGGGGTETTNFDELQEVSPTKAVELGVFEDPKSAAEMPQLQSGEVESQAPKDLDGEAGEQDQATEVPDVQASSNNSQAKEKTSGGGFFDFDDLDEAEMG